MKKIKAICTATFLSLALSISAFAGDISSPGAPSPGGIGTPGAVSTGSATSTDATDALASILMALVSML